MNRPMLARSVMVTRIVTLNPDMDVFDAIGLLLRHRISGAPVVDETGQFLGVFSEKCCMRTLLEAAVDSLSGTTVATFVDRKAPSVDEETDLLTIARIFHGTHRRRLPVVRDGKIVGQISRRDVMRAAFDMMSMAGDRETGLAYLGQILDHKEEIAA